MELEVVIMSGAGNIFTIVDNTDSRLSDDFFKRNAPKISKLSYSNKLTDGIIVIEKDETGKSDFKMKFFNIDGSYGMMCGNGGRCAVFYAQITNLIPKSKVPIVFDVWGKRYFAHLKDSKVELVFPPPLKVELNKNVELLFENKIFGDYINVNTPHFVINFNNIPTTKNFFEYELEELAKELMYKDDFKPDGVNVNIFQIIDEKIYLRTYEKGGPGETGSCGTGAIATAVSIFIRDKNKTKFEIIPPSKENLFVELITEQEQRIKQILLSGDTKLLHNTKIEFFPT